MSLKDDLFGILGVREGVDASGYQAHLNDVQDRLFEHGFGLQRRSFKPNAATGRIYVPHAGCPSCAPRTEEERVLGCKQGDPQAYVYFVDTVAADGSKWVWEDHSGGAYLPLVPDIPTPDPDTDLHRRVFQLETLVRLLEQGLTDLSSRNEALNKNLLSAQDRLLQVEFTVELILSRLSQPIRTTPVGVGPFKHSHEVKI